MPHGVRRESSRTTLEIPRRAMERPFGTLPHVRNALLNGRAFFVCGRRVGCDGVRGRERSGVRAGPCRGAPPGGPQRAKRALSQ